MCSVQTQFASSKVHNKELIAKGVKVKEVIYESEGKGWEQNSYNISEGMGLNFTYFQHDFSGISDAETRFKQKWLLPFY